MYNVKLTEKQIRVINRALEVYSRLEIGQFNTAISLTDLYMNKICEDFIHSDLDNVLTPLSNLFGFSSINASHGIYSEQVAQDAKESYAIQTVLRHQLWKDSENKRQYTVDADDMIMANLEPKVKIEKE